MVVGQPSINSALHTSKTVKLTVDKKKRYPLVMIDLLRIYRRLQKTWKMKWCIVLVQIDVLLLATSTIILDVELILTASPSQTNKLCVKYPSSSCRKETGSSTVVVSQNVSAR